MYQHRHTYLSIYIYIYMYIYICPGCQVSRSPPKRGGGPPGWAPPASGICMPSMHMNTYPFICMSTCICISTSTYACTAYACKHIRAWHVCTYICLHGMHAYMQASCHVHLHTTPTGGGGIPTWVRPFCSISYGPLHCPPHIPQGGGSITITTPSPLVGGGRGTPGPRDI